jgi:antitoxin (DNA-binding transcriptional repressor) of toxin-antitoxin stability system
MDRLTVSQAEQNFSGLVNRVYSEGLSIELERGDKVVAYLTPALPKSSLRVAGLAAFLVGLPKLGDDAEQFSADLRAVRNELPLEKDPSA